MRHWHAEHIAQRQELAQSTKSVQPVTQHMTSHSSAPLAIGTMPLSVPAGEEHFAEIVLRNQGLTTQQISALARNASPVPPGSGVPQPRSFPLSRAASASADQHDGAEPLGALARLQQHRTVHSGHDTSVVTGGDASSHTLVHTTASSASMQPPPGQPSRRTDSGNTAGRSAATAAPPASQSGTCKRAESGPLVVHAPTTTSVHSNSLPVGQSIPMWPALNNPRAGAAVADNLSPQPSQSAPGITAGQASDGTSSDPSASKLIMQRRIGAPGMPARSQSPGSGGVAPSVDVAAGTSASKPINIVQSVRCCLVAPLSRGATCPACRKHLLAAMHSRAHNAAGHFMVALPTPACRRFLLHGTTRHVYQAHVHGACCSALPTKIILTNEVASPPQPCQTPPCCAAQQVLLRGVLGAAEPGGGHRHGHAAGARG